MTLAQIGKRVERLREDRHLTRAQFGKLIGVTGQHIGMFEKGIHGLSIESFVKICHTTGVSADYILFGGICPPRSTISMTLTDGLSNEQIQIVFDIINKIVQFVNSDNGNEALIQEVASQLKHSPIYTV